MRSTQYASELSKYIYITHVLLESNLEAKHRGHPANLFIPSKHLGLSQHIQQQPADPRSTVWQSRKFSDSSNDKAVFVGVLVYVAFPQPGESRGAGVDLLFLILARANGEHITSEAARRRQSFHVP